MNYRRQDNQQFYFRHEKGEQTKRPKGQNVSRQNVLRHNVPRTKHPKGQNFPRDKTSQETKKILHFNFQFFKN